MIRYLIFLPCFILFSNLALGQSHSLNIVALDYGGKTGINYTIESRLGLGDRHSFNQSLRLKAFKITGADIASILFAVASGIGGGANNAFHKDPYVFENKGWKGKYWRHNGWENNYPGGNYNEGETPIKPEFLNGFRDVWHGSEDLEIFGLSCMLSIQGISEGIRLGKGKGKWWHTAAKIGGLQLLRIGTKKLTYNYLAK